jgi:hypothetical protein
VAPVKLRLCRFTEDANVRALVERRSLPFHMRWLLRRAGYTVLVGPMKRPAGGAFVEVGVRFNFWARVFFRLVDRPQLAV